MNLITLTGADEATDIAALVDLVSNPAVEIGLLYSASPEGRNRYPSLPWLLDAAQALRGRCAIHICGGIARHQLLAGELSHLVQLAGRVQVNGRMAEDVALKCAALVPHLITQHFSFTAHLATLAITNHSVLVDGSGGRGISPERWIRATVSPGKAVGFAGGLGPDNLAEQIQVIAAASAGHDSTTWIDMEGKLRDADDRFDLARARRCVEIFTESLQAV